MSKDLLEDDLKTLAGDRRPRVVGVVEFLRDDFWIESVSVAHGFYKEWTFADGSPDWVLADDDRPSIEVDGFDSPRLVEKTKTDYDLMARDVVTLLSVDIIEPNPIHDAPDMGRSIAPLALSGEPGYAS